MDRRGLLQGLMLGASALAVDPERLLWVPGKKKIFIPPQTRQLISAEVEGLRTILYLQNSVTKEWVPITGINGSLLEFGLIDIPALPPGEIRIDYGVEPGDRFPLITY